jgi:hypothetical protein
LVPALLLIRNLILFQIAGELNPYEKDVLGEPALFMAIAVTLLTDLPVVPKPLNLTT